jgi:hypothetical protein
VQVRLRGTEAEIDSAIAKMETLLTVWDRSRPVPLGADTLEVCVQVQL